MTVPALEQACRSYVKNTSTIRALSSVNVEDLKYSSEYREILKDNFISIREYAAENRTILQDILYPLLRSDRLLEDEEIQILTNLKNELLDAYILSNLDNSITAMIVDRLMLDARAKGDLAYIIEQLDAQIESCYALTYYNDRIGSNQFISQDFREKGQKAFHAFECLTEKSVFSCIEDPESRETVLTNYRYMHAIYEKTYGDPENNAMLLRLFDHCMEMAADPFYHDLVPDYDWDYFEVRVLEYIVSMTEYCNRKQLNEEQLEKVYQYALQFDRKWHSDPALYSQYTLEGELQFALTRNYFLHGDLSVEAYQARLLEIYASRDTGSRELGNTYLNLLLPMEYILVCRDQAPMKEATRATILQFYRDIVSYAHQATTTGEFSIFLNYYINLIYSFPDISETFSFEELCLESLAALHPPTYVHSIMVAQLSRCLCKHLLEKRPELLVGVLGYDTPEKVHEHRTEILTHIYHGALLHDIGKLAILDTVFIYGRSLTDDEFQTIRSHPLLGERLALNHRSSSIYADIIRNHHVSYDGKHGYPLPALPTPNKILVDIVMVCDCMDAATDSIGRSYAAGKTLEQYICEVEAGSGTTFSPDVCAILRDPDTRSDLDYLLEAGRNNTYADTFVLLKNVQEQAGGSPDAEDHLEEFDRVLAEKESLRTAMELISYDLETIAPEKGIEAEIDALALLSVKEKECVTSSRTEHLLRKVTHMEIADQRLKKSCQVLWKAHLEQKKIPFSFHESFVKAKAVSEKVWESAKAHNNYCEFAPYLEKVIEMTRQECEYIDPNRSPYELLIERNETGMDLETVDQVFAEVKQGISPILQKILRSELPALPCLKGRYPVPAQKQVGALLLDYIGFDREAGYIGESMHPFTVRVGCNNIRMTNTYTEAEGINAMFSSIHEGGHGLLEQGIDRCYCKTEAARLDHQMGLHESQSRFYENILGRNIHFWEPIYGEVQKLLPPLSRISISEFERIINHVQPGPIRVDADELTYCLHILLRHEMELAIFRDQLPVRELPELWNAKSQELLGITPSSDAEGILQDMHWSDGSFGYFPSYLLGSVYDGLFLEALEKDLGSVDRILEAGRIRDITAWLREKIHRYGSLYSSAEILQRVCGTPLSGLSAAALIRYFEQKYSRLYRF